MRDGMHVWRFETPSGETLEVTAPRGRGRHHNTFVAFTFVDAGGGFDGGIIMSRDDAAAELMVLRRFAAQEELP